MVSEDYRIQKIDNLILKGKKVAAEKFQSNVTLPENVVNPISFSIWVAEVQQFLLDNIESNNVFVIKFNNMVKKTENHLPFIGNTAHGILLLESLRTYLIENPSSFPKKKDSSKQLPEEKIQHNRKIFIVHGHNETIKNAVETFLESLNLEPIILHKQADLGKTIIEKVEYYSDVSFAVILITADDFGCTLGDPELVTRIKEDHSFASLMGVKEKTQRIVRPQGTHQLRARQNVIFEFGFFIAKLGRNRVAALCEDGIERPSDIDGLLYTQIDNFGEWKKKLAMEINAAGIKIDEKHLC